MKSIVEKKKICRVFPKEGGKLCRFKLDGDWESFQKADVNGSFSSFKKGMLDMEALGKLAFQQYAGKGNISAGFDEFMQINLYGNTNSKKAGRDADLSKQGINFNLSLLKEFTSNSKSFIFIMKIDDKPCAGILSIIVNDSIYIVKTSIENNPKVNLAHVLYYSFIRQLYKLELKNLEFLEYESDEDFLMMSQPKLYQTNFYSESKYKKLVSAS